MSLVVAYISNKYSVIVSDGRATGDIGSETCNKTFKINNHTIGGFCGILEDVQMIMPALEEYEFVNAEEFAEYIEFQLDEKPSDILFAAHFVIVGQNRDRKLCKFEIGNLTNNKLIKTIIPPSGMFFYMGGTESANRIQSIFNNNIKDNTLTILGKLKKTILDVARIDKSVNDNCFIQKMICY